MSRYQHFTWLLLALVVPVAMLSPRESQAAGPWKAQVLEAETGKPLEGVVVLAVWYRRYTSPGGWAGGGYYASEEVVTGPDGRFVIQARSTFTLLPFLTTIQGPEFLIFKPGYGQWRFQGSDNWPKDAYEYGMRSREAWRQFEGEGVVIELPPLKTRKERLDFFPPRPGDVPDSKMPRYLEAVNQERVFLGLEPSGRGK
jgi:hypothetical protein